MNGHIKQRMLRFEKILKEEIANLTPAEQKDLDQLAKEMNYHQTNHGDLVYGKPIDPKQNFMSEDQARHLAEQERAAENQTLADSQEGSVEEPDHA